MLDLFGETQQRLLRQLHQKKAGMTIDQLATSLAVTRTAVKQHLTSLDKAGFVEKASLCFARGRPSRLFRLAPRGEDLFPKQYSWFSGLLIGAIKAEHGSDGLREHLRGLARSISRLLEARVQAKEGDDRLEEVVAIMNELSYEAITKPMPDSGATPALGVEAHNCVYHHLAEKYPEVCEFDLELLAGLTGRAVKHGECIVRGGSACRFTFGPRAASPRPDEAADGDSPQQKR